MRRARPAAGVVAGLVGAIAVALLPALPAAAVGPVMLSTDGVLWRTSLDDRLFGGEAFIPGDERTSSMEVRNTNDVPLAVDLRAVSLRSSSTAVASALAARGAVGDAGLPAVSLRELAGCGQLTTWVVVQPGQTVPLTVGLEMLDVTGATAQDGTADFDVMIDTSEDLGLEGTTQCPRIAPDSDPAGGDDGGAQPSTPVRTDGDGGGAGSGIAASTSPSGAITAADPVSRALGAAHRGLLAITGTDAGAAVALGGIGVLVGLLFLLLGRRRRRRDREEEAA